MGKAHICWCCHMVRHCKQCCKRCTSPCNTQYDCSIPLMTENQGWEWYLSVKAVMGGYEAEAVPEDIIRTVRKMTAKPIQLTFDF